MTSVREESGTQTLPDLRAAVAEQFAAAFERRPHHVELERLDAALVAS